MTNETNTLLFILFADEISMFKMVTSEEVKCFIVNVIKCCVAE